VPGIVQDLTLASCLAIGRKPPYFGTEGELPMANVEKVSIAVTPEMAATMRAVVESGEYASASEVVRDALREWKIRRAQREQAIEELGRLWDVGIESGPAGDGKQTFTRLRTSLDAKFSDGD
jgi:antitoxin ParD1/3/4